MKIDINTSKVPDLVSVPFLIFVVGAFVFVVGMAVASLVRFG